jgi:hypothetical protein
MRRPAIQGEGRAGCIFWLLVALIFGIIAFQTIPVKIATMQLEDFMKEMAMTQARQPQHWFEQRISERAIELDLDIPKDQIRVKKYPERVIMDVEFTKVVDIFGYEYNWKIKIHLDRDLFFF